ncbi:hypothetical protein B0H17DRAFT_1197619 [Mycena rosella]|uniref:Uncharacterized protein n=1 Tax=Mycena rosella TaxID=1033263 RepID=A0AAD7DQC6_MYCRO|nr:hypothetical protein B0H17DRAFT_1197619 [Mycena rosella]
MNPGSSDAGMSDAPSPTILRPSPEQRDITCRTRQQPRLPPRTLRGPGVMSDADAAPPSLLAHLAREFLVTLALSYLALLALLYTIQYHVLRFLGSEAGAECTPCVRIVRELAALSPVAVLEVTTACTVLVFLGLVASLCIQQWGFPRAQEPDLEAAGGLSFGSKAESKPRLKAKHADVTLAETISSRAGSTAPHIFILG